MRIPHDERMPETVGTAKIEGEADDYQDIAEKRGEHGGAQYRLVFFDIEDVNDGDEREAAGGEAYAAHYVEGDPETPGKLVAEVGRAAQAVHHAQVRGV